MKVFKFKLEALLLLKQARMQKALEVYATAMHKIVEIQGLYQTIVEKEMGLRGEVESSRIGSVQVSEQASYYYLLHENSNLKMKARNLLDDLKNQASEAFGKFLKCKLEVDAMEKYKNKKKQLFLKEQFQKEQQVIEDIVNARFSQKD